MPKLNSIPIFSTVDTGLKKAEVELWWPSFVIFIRLPLDVDICKFFAGETMQSDESEKIKIGS